MSPEPQIPRQGSTCHGCDHDPHPLGEAQSQQAADVPRCRCSQVFPGQVVFGDLFASLHDLSCLNSEEMCPAFLLVQSALPWSVTGTAQGPGAGVILLAWPELWAAGGLETCPCPLHIQISFVSVELQTSAKWGGSHSSSKNRPDKYIPLLRGCLSPHYISSDEGRKLAVNPLQGVLVIN